MGTSTIRLPGTWSIQIPARCIRWYAMRRTGNFYWPIRTVHGNEDPNAVVGEYAMQMGGYVDWCSNHVPEEDRIFKLYLLLPDGRMQASEPFYVDF